MNDIQKTLLELVRCANRHSVNIGDIVPILCERFGLSREDRAAIGEMLKADMREKHALLPTYEEVNTRLQRMSFDNPHGV